ncbi:RsfA family transcriptional regulator [Pseudalkalibacillus salsuginis]|uniref:RsfA family transcriptional regulator n=1 Tax=Pseudalkalibacillus salsuginis TaxID=2910972 RepID=UPI001F3D312E|nr:RsfA family transcriptional regulator [Pseudalkalibacillus salsuginis]MCF6410454.1 RsfA family transcriptional regulator [Pseudalkalibacillus salsuginis]
MGSTRQDAWNHDEDLLLAEVVLRHIREGGTQLAAFEEVGKKLSRTSAACGFRWNSLIRKKYDAAIAIAKKQRKQMMKEKQPKTHSATNAGQQSHTPQNDQEEIRVMNRTDVKSDLCMDDVIYYLQSIRSAEQNTHTIQGENERLKEELLKLEKENEVLSHKLQKLQTDYEHVYEDYKIMLNFMERARKMAVTDGDEQDSQVKFQMDYNGNLEKVEK